MTLELPDKLEGMHVLLAYAGLMIHTLGKLKKASNAADFTFKKFLRSHVINFIGSMLMIPVVLIIACDPASGDLLPINYLTSVLAGWQTNSTFRWIVGMYGKKKGTPAMEDQDE